MDMIKAVVQYKFDDLIRLPDDESGSVAYFLSDYLMQHLDDATITSVAEYKKPQHHECDLSDEEASYIDIIIALDNHFLENPDANHREINIAVAQKLANCAFSVEEQLQCFNERFFVIEPYGKEDDNNKKTSA